MLFSNQPPEKPHLQLYSGSMKGLQLEREYSITTTFDKKNTINPWDSCIGAHLRIWMNGNAEHAPKLLASCVLGGFIEVAGKIYGLTVAHPLRFPLLDSKRNNPDEIQEGVKGGSEIEIGTFNACTFGNSSTRDGQQTKVNNADWALVNMSVKFNIAQLKHSRAAKFTAVGEDEFRVEKDEDLLLRDVVIQTASSNIQGRLSMIKSWLLMDSERFAVLRITIHKPLGMCSKLIFLAPVSK